MSNVSSVVFSAHIGLDFEHKNYKEKMANFKSSVKKIIGNLPYYVNIRGKDKENNKITKCDIYSFDGIEYVNYLFRFTLLTPGYVAFDLKKIKLEFENNVNRAFYYIGNEEKPNFTKREGVKHSVKNYR